MIEMLEALIIGILSFLVLGSLAAIKLSGDISLEEEKRDLKKIIKNKIEIKGVENGKRP
jgi:hypothetical protein